MRKFLLIFGLFVTAVGIGSITEEIHGCFMTPIYGFLNLFGKTSGDAFGFLVEICWQTIGVGIFITLIALLFYPNRKELWNKLTFKYPKINTWKKRRTLVHLFIYALITFHIVLSILGKTSIKSVCPRSAFELLAHGVIGTSAMFWIAVLLLVPVWGRALCGWICVYAPVQEQSANLLSAFGIKLNKIKYKQTGLIYLTTAFFWGTVIYYIAKNTGNYNFNSTNGYELNSLWVFLGGAILMVPLTMFFTYFYGHRYFCKYICPIGGLQSLYSKLGLIKVKIDHDKCINCGACTKNCQMSVNVAKHIENYGPAISDGRCISCGDCIDRCPKKALQFGFAYSKPNTIQQEISSPEVPRKSA
ncbi:MAG: 4Fe-4S binding protein [Clostridiales bacterium]